MAEYIFLDIGAEWDLAFPFREAARVHHSCEEVFPQLREEAVPLPEIFGTGAADPRPPVILTMNDSSSFLAFDSYISGRASEIEIFPVPPALFEKGMAWAKAVLKQGRKLSFSVNKEVLAGLKNG